MISSGVRERIEQARRSHVLRLDPNDYSSSTASNIGRLAELPDEVRELTDLKELILRDQSFRALPDWIAELTSLETLDLSNNGLETVPEVVTRLRSLRNLGLSSNQLTGLPADIGNLTGLTALVLPGNRVRQLPLSIGALDRLQVLDLGGNFLSDLPEPIHLLTRLTHLILWGNHFSEIPAELSAFRDLVLLDFSCSGVNDVRGSWPQDHPPRLADPTAPLSRQVGATFTRKERFKSIPDWLPAALPKLQAIYLSQHDITDLPRSFGALTELKSLFLSDNKLATVPGPVFELTALRQLDLHQNSIRDFPANLAQLRELDYLDLAGNPLPIPPEVLERPKEPKAIIEYAGRVRTATRPLNEAKLIIVGEGSVGKTSLVKRITRNSFDENENMTEGIAVTRWENLPGEHNITLNIWDFGGQEIMHATHQFFMTKRSIYVLVVDARQNEEQNRIEYWLKLIQSFSDHSPVIIVGNKCDQARLDIDRRGLRKKYEDIIGIVSASCQTGEGVDGVKKVLTRAVTKLPNVRDLVPVAFFDVKQHLEELKINYVSFSDYEELCVDSGITTRASQDLLIDLLHDLGTVLCFRHDPRLADTNILNPSWVTGGVYRLINSGLAAQRKGVLDWPVINDILECDDYPMERRSFIVEMMKKFELCYESVDGDFLVPDLMPKEEPDTGSWTGALHFEIKYDILPSSIVSRLIVRMKALISKGTVWRTGVVLRMDRNRALVNGDQEDAVISVDVSGPTNGRRGLLTAIRTELRAIERTIPGLTVEERVPVPGHTGISVPYDHLLMLDAAGHTTVIPQGLTEEFNVKELLDGVETPEARDASRTVASRDIAKPPASARDRDPDDSRPWTVGQSIGLGSFLLLGVIVVLAACIATYKFVNAGVAAAAGALALAVIVVVGLFILRASGRISEKGLIKGTKQALALLGNSKD